MEEAEAAADELAALAVLLEANGHGNGSGSSGAEGDSDNTAAAIRKASTVVKLEMFLQDYPKMLALSFFTALTELRLIDQRIERIKGLERCPHLKKLWLIENRISEISNLQSATALQELYLTTNRITDITGLEQLTGLQVLWLADNYISSIAGISQLVKLQQLNLARNDICLIGNSLQHNSSLTSLNLAHNQISSLQDAVLGLSSLASLQDLCLGDPFWGDCPVTALSNYQTFVLAQLPQLSCLDTLLVAPETKAAAAVTFAKKQLFYNMRNRTLGRAVGELCRQARASQQAKASRVLDTYAGLAYAAKRLESQLLQEEGQAAEAALQHQQSLTADMQAAVQHLSSQGAAVAQDCCAAHAALQVATQRLQLELASAGNIWLEEGSPGDAWMQSYQDVLGSSAGMSQGGRRVQVLAAARIHNRALRAEFSRHAKPGMDAQHLFFSDPAADLMSIAQHGFSPEHNAWRVRPAVRLSSRLEPLAAACSAGGGSGVMQTLVCRAHLHGPCKAVAEIETGHLQQYQSLQAVFCDLAPAQRSSSTGSSSGSSMKQGISEQPPPRVWHVFEHTALLPEYLITWQWASTAPAADAAAAQAGSASAAAYSAPDCKDPLLRLCAQPLSRWLHGAQQQPDAGVQALQQQCAAALAAVPQLPQAAQLAAITSTALVQVVPGKQLQGLTQLCLQDCGCSHFGGLLSHLPSLVVLALPFNKITSLERLAHAAPSNKLAELDVSHNHISSWSSTWLSGCTSLTALDASFNTITQPEGAQSLARSLPHLQQLDLRFNPVQQHKAYSVALSALTALSLDGQAVRQLEQQGVAANSCLTPALLREKATLWHSQTGPVPVLSSLGSTDWRLQLHSVVLEGLGITSLRGLSAACNLVSASFADNLLDSLTDLTALNRLTSLSISNNLITQLTPLSSVVSLQQLDVSCNCIASLASVTSLTGLVELYAAHNSLQHIKEAECLHVLPRLMVLDLVGNPLVDSTDGYRLLLLFRLGSLKVLDGAAADAEELAAAQAQHAGWLTLSMLEDHLGSDVQLSVLRHLDLSGRSLRDLGAVFAASGLLAALTSLTLDGNHLTSLAPLSGLSRLCVLSVNNNTARPQDSCSFCFAATQPQVPAPAEEPQQQQGAGSCNTQAAADSLGSLLPSLHTLQLAGCGLTSLLPLQLQRLPALRSLFVQGNELSRLDGLEGLGHLRELVADKNRLRVFEPELLSSLSRLQELRVEDNAIRAISGGGLGVGPPQLRVLMLANNRLIDAADCAQRFAATPSLLEVSVAGNPFTRKQGHRQQLIGSCSQLQVIDGQRVTDEERECVAASMDSPRNMLDSTTAAALLAAAAAASPSLLAAPTVPPLARVAAANCRSSWGAEPCSPKAPPGAVPTVLSYEGLANLAAVRQNLLGLGGPAGMSSAGILQTSVPSIQSGVLVLTGSASFGLEGTAMRAACSSSGCWPTKAGSRQPAGQQQSSPPGKVARGTNNRRTTTGSIASCRAGGFVVRQATFQQ